MAVAALVLGIIGLVVSIFSFGVLGWVGAALSLIGIILGAVGRKDPEKKKLATGGLVVSIIGFILGVVLFIACAMVANEVVDHYDGMTEDEIRQELEEVFEEYK